MKYIIISILILNVNLYSQSGQIYETYKTKVDSTDESNGTVFPKPFQTFNYIKTHRGIELYETYKTRTGSTDESKGTIFSKPFPKYIIINNKVYRTYNTATSKTNGENGTIFTKPFEASQILENVPIPSLKDDNKKEIKISYEIKYKQPLPRYSGEGEITYGE
jgi:hypothetical protein